MKSFEIKRYYGTGGLIGTTESFVVEARTAEEAVELLLAFPSYYAPKRSFELDFFNIENVEEK